MADDAVLRAEAEAYVRDLRRRRHRRAVRLARFSRVSFALALAGLIFVVATWVLGALQAASSGFRLLLLGSATLLALSLLTGALSGVVGREAARPTSEEGAGDGDPDADAPATALADPEGDQPKNVRPTS